MCDVDQAGAEKDDMAKPGLRHCVGLFMFNLFVNCITEKLYKRPFFYSMSKGGEVVNKEMLENCFKAFFVFPPFIIQ